MFKVDGMPVSALDDTALMAEAAHGEVTALSALYDRHAPVMLAVATRILGERELAEELVHDVFMEVWRNASRYEAERGTVRTWILVRLRSRALDRRRATAARREHVTDELPDDVGARAFAAVDPSPDRETIANALVALPDEQRRVLELAYYDGLSATEIAERTGSPVGTVKSRTAAALRKLRATIIEGGVR